MENQNLTNGSKENELNFIQKTKAIPNERQIWKSTNYNDFYFDPDHRNRSVNVRKVENIKYSMGYYKEFLDAPIQVNSTGLIVEGQHRFQAAKELGIPIKFIINDNLTLDDIDVFNNATAR